MRLTHTKNYLCLLAFTFFASLSLSVHSEVVEVYKTVDKKGKVTFSDTPKPNADKVEVRILNTAEPVDTSITHNDDQAKATTSPTYDTLKITAPANDGIIANGLIGFTVNTQVSPKLAPEHRLQLIIDGALHSASQNNFQIPSIDRGPHQLQIEVVNSEGAVVQQSSPVKIFVYWPGQ